MRNKVLFFLIVFAVIFSVFSILPRYNVEEENRDIELVYDDNYLNELGEKVEAGKTNILKLFQENGLTGVAVYPDTVRTLVKKNIASLIGADEFISFNLLSSDINPVYNKFEFTDSSSFFITENAALKSRLREVLPYWQKEYGLEYKEEGKKLIIFFPEWDVKYLDLAAGFQKENIENIKNAGLQVIPRLNNDIIGYDQRGFLKKSDSEMIIFSGKEILGYEEELEETALIMNNNKIKFGMIEPFIADQTGSDKLARLLNYKTVRVHSLEQGEMDKYEKETIINRYLRAVRERDVRVLYLKPFLEEKNGDLLTANIQFIKDLTTAFKQQGYIIAGARPYRYFASPLLYLLIISTGIFAVGIFLLEKLLKHRLKFSFYILLLLVAGAEILLIMQGKIILLRQILALGSSIIFPVLAVITGLNKSCSEHWLFSFLRVIGISLLGVLFMIASLSELSFLLKVNQFRGVKLSFLIPLILISYYYYREYIIAGDKTIARMAVSFLETEIKIKHVLILFLIGVGGIIYIGRSGNYPLLPVPAWEISLRDLLEKYLYIRPRFKAFLFGHPFLVIILALKYRKKFKLLLYPAVLLATIGQITVLNTFSHIHTPLQVSFIRFVNGVWLGLLLGLVLLGIIRVFVYIKEKLYV